MDEDGANPDLPHPRQTIMVLTPRFNPTAQMIAYMSYIGGKPRVYLFDIETGKQEMLGNFPNMTFSPRFSPDGNRVALTLETGGNSDIYVMDLRTRAIDAPDHRSGASTPRPSSRPTARQIAFESDRGGSQQIYVMNADGSGQRRISFGAGTQRHAGLDPARRPDRLHQAGRAARFTIGVMRPDGSGERHDLPTAGRMKARPGRPMAGC